MKVSTLRDPFPADAIEWRLARSGEKDGTIWAKCLAYVTARAIMDRLDEVCGPENWQVVYEVGHGHMMAGIGIRVADEWVWKWDGAGNLASNDGLSGTDAGKGDFSNAMKRAAVQWGIGRYLYDIPEGWANVHRDGRFFGRTKSKQSFRWDPPELPPWALPGGDGKPREPVVNRETGEVEDDPPPPRHPTPAPDADDMIPCPKCAGEMWDNREDKKNPRAPDLKCKDKEGCDTAIWLSTWRDDLRKEIEAAHAAGVVDAQQRAAMEEYAASKSPKKMQSVAGRLAELSQEVAA